MPYFIRPMWLLCLIPLVIIMWWIYYKGNKSDSWPRVIDRHLLPHLLVSMGSINRMPIILLGLGWLLLIIILSGPSWSRVQSPVFKSTATTVIILDLSNEMLVKDVSPDRLSRAKYKISDLMDKDDRRFGLSVFSGAAFTVSPVTTDHETIGSMLSELIPNIMPVEGKNISKGLEEGYKLMRNSGQLKGSMLLITTGEANKLDIAIAKKIYRKGVKTFVVGVGTKIGGPIPSGKGHKTTDKGSVILSKLNPSSLASLAKAGGGAYQTLSHDSSDIDAITKYWKDDAKSLQEDTYVEIIRDDGYWFLWLLLPIAALAFRRGWRESIL